MKYKQTAVQVYVIYNIHFPLLMWISLAENKLKFGVASDININVS